MPIPKTPVKNQQGLTALITAVSFCTLASGTMADPQISRLPAGPHMGMIRGFDDLRPGQDGIDRLARADELRAAAIDAGMTIGRVQIDWRDLELAPGVYDAETLTEALEYAGRDGQFVFVTLSSIDTNELTLPDYLSDENGQVVDGRRLSDPEINQPYLAFLDWFVPVLGKHQVWGLALSNEVDAAINDGIVTSSDALAHLLAGARRTRMLDPKIAVTVTLTGDANRHNPDFTGALLADLDIVSFNTYCLSDYLTVNSPRDWQDVLTRWKATAGTKQIFIQELGCPIGYGADQRGPNAGRENGINGSAQIQAVFFAFYLSEFARDPQLRAATVFQLYDWSPQLAGLYEPALAAAGEPLAGARLTEWLATVGLCRWSDTSCGPAWDAFLTGLAAIKASRAE